MSEKKHENIDSKKIKVLIKLGISEKNFLKVKKEFENKKRHKKNI